MPTAPLTERLALDRASARSFDQAGHLHVSRNVLSRANVCGYYGREIVGSDALGLDPNRVYQLLRDPAALEASASSFNGKPLTIIHRAQTAADHDREITVGAISNVRYEAPELIGELTVWDKEGIDLIESDQQSDLSLGYFYEVVPEAGTYEGVQFDLKMIGIQGNHCSLVEEGRVIGAFVGDAALSPAAPAEPAVAEPTPTPNRSTAPWRSPFRVRPPSPWAR